MIPSQLLPQAYLDVSHIRKFFRNPGYAMDP